MADTESPEVANDSLEPLFDDDWDTYNLEWLFDPDRTDHLTIDEQLKLYQQRNLRRTKVYKFASKIWGSPASRKRVFYASSHNVPQYGEENVLRKAKLEKDALTQLEKDSEHLASGLKATEVLREYKIWINERKKFRNQIDLMRLSEEWLRRKPDKTGQEQRVLARMIEKKLIRPPSPVVCIVSYIPVDRYDSQRMCLTVLLIISIIIIIICTSLLSEHRLGLPLLKEMSEISRSDILKLGNNCSYVHKMLYT